MAFNLFGGKRRITKGFFANSLGNKQTRGIYTFQIDVENGELIFKKYFVTSFDMYSLKKGIELLRNLKNQLNLTKILYDFELKKNTTIISEKIITNELNKEILVNAINLFNSLDKVDIMRIDGRLHNNDFYCIELSPDAYLGKDTTFALAYQHNNKTYSDMLFTLLNNSIESD